MIAWLLDALVASTILMLVVLAVRRPAARLFGPRIAYALWLLPALRMVLPSMPEAVSVAAPLPMLSSVQFSSLPRVYSLGHVPHVAAVSAPVDWNIALVWIWSAGAVLTFGLALVAHDRFQKAIKAGGRRVGNVDGVPLWTSAAVGGPLAFGLVAPGVAIPQDYMDRYAPDELEFVLRHESMHHRRRDLAGNLAALVVRSLHWFNPIAYWAHRAFRDDQELACDAAVLADENAAGRQAYAWALVKSACGIFPAAASAMDGKGQLKRRLTMMNRKKNSRVQALASAALIAAAIGTGLGITASDSIAAPTPKTVQRFVSAAVPMVRAIPPLSPAASHIASPPATVSASIASVAPPVAGIAAVSNVQHVYRVPQPQHLPEALAAPPAPEAPAVLAAPVAPVIPDIDSTVQMAMTQARANIAQARAQVAQVHVDVAQIHRDVASSLRASIAEIRAERDIPRDVRAHIIASMEREIATFERD